MKNLGKVAIAALFGAGALALTAGTAMADVVCNAEGECWHQRHHYDYHPEFGLTVHPDGWAWGPNDHYRWHEHHGRGYWKSGVWVTF
jgi:hypothetical protein